VSSTAIRRAVAGGDLQRAALGLGRPYTATGSVVHGEKRGRLLGFPTLNVALPSPRKLLPPEGVYAVRVYTPIGAHGGMLNLGPRPTFGDATRSLEAHLFDVEGDWYGQTVQVEFAARLRDTRRFDGVEALTAQLMRDAQHARRALAGGLAAAR
jgi:riboflavin kinase/FMN adenylyltransferase